MLSFKSLCNVISMSPEINYEFEILLLGSYHCKAGTILSRHQIARKLSNSCANYTFIELLRIEICIAIVMV